MKTLIAYRTKYGTAAGCARGARGEDRGGHGHWPTSRMHAT